LVIDSSKFDQVSFALICPVNTIDYIVTDRIEESERVQYEKIGVRIIT